MAPRIDPEKNEAKEPAELEALSGWSESDEWENGMVESVLYTQPWWRNQPRLGQVSIAS